MTIKLLEFLFFEQNDLTFSSLGDQLLPACAALISLVISNVPV